METVTLLSLQAPPFSALLNHNLTVITFLIRVFDICSELQGVFAFVHVKCCAATFQSTTGYAKYVWI